MECGGSCSVSLRCSWHTDLSSGWYPTASPGLIAIDKVQGKEVTPGCSDQCFRPSQFLGCLTIDNLVINSHSSSHPLSAYYYLILKKLSVFPSSPSSRAEWAPGHGSHANPGHLLSLTDHILFHGSSHHLSIDNPKPTAPGWAVLQALHRLFWFQALAAQLTGHTRIVPPAHRVYMGNPHVLTGQCFLTQLVVPLVTQSLKSETSAPSLPPFFFPLTHPRDSTLY